MPISVLLIDDEQDFSSVLSKRLTKAGYNVSTAGSGSEALTMLKSGISFDVTVLDVKMPGKNGLETLFSIKKINSQTEVIMLSAYGTPQCTIECLRWGARYFLNKPVNFDELEEKIRESATKFRTGPASSQPDSGIRTCEL
ncbi:response regulator [Maridesulfovibrio sp. FT414]|uniref:response regulator n=1 Tax=Maridesulfovibrio sp. FT414 TaxID=2979469 RepID=UPI003D809895